MLQNENIKNMDAMMCSCAKDWDVPNEQDKIFSRSILTS